MESVFILEQEYCCGYLDIYLFIWGGEGGGCHIAGSPSWLGGPGHSSGILPDYLACNLGLSIYPLVVGH